MIYRESNDKASLYAGYDTAEGLKSMRLRGSVTRRPEWEWDAFASAVVMWDAREGQR